VEEKKERRRGWEDCGIGGEGGSQRGGSQGVGGGGDHTDAIVWREVVYPRSAHLKTTRGWRRSTKKGMQ
jgi:hypothetical protein